MKWRKKLTGQFALIRTTWCSPKEMGFSLLRGEHQPLDTRKYLLHYSKHYKAEEHGLIIIVSGVLKNEHLFFFNIRTVE